MQPLLVDWSDRQLYPVEEPRHIAANKRPVSRALLQRSWKHWLPFLKHTSDPASVSPQATARLNTFSALTGIAEQIAAEGQHAFSVLMQLAKQAKVSADRMRQQTTTLDDLQRLATETGQSAEDSRERIVEAQTLIEECAEIASGRTQLIEDVLENVHFSETNLSALNDRIDQVERFVSTIQQIGNQTSLLALNAAIEASRAGVQGTGFNVVAREMRMLADRTEAATQEILNIIKGMHQSSAATSASMQEAIGRSHDNDEIGRRVVGVVQRCGTLLGEAEVAASHAVRGTEAQGAVIDTFREDWRTLRQGARQCTFNADAAAERTMQSISLAVGLNKGLAQLAAEIPAASTSERFAFDQQSAALRKSAAACSGQTGLAELKHFRPHILQSLEELRATFASLGPASCRASADGSPVPELCFGTNKMNGNSAQIDSLSRTSGLIMTLMVLSEEKPPEFHRIATSVRRGDGQRAVDTQLNPRTSAAQKLLRGESTYGYVYILGLPYLSAYAPILNASGQVIGAVCAGMAAKYDGTSPLAENARIEENTCSVRPSRERS